MRKIVKVFNVYKYDELSENQKLKVLEKQWDINVNCDWWNYIYEDAENIGLKIQEFDIDRGSYCKFKILWSLEEIAQKILSDHGGDCEIYKSAKEFLNIYKSLKEKFGIYGDIFYNGSEIPWIDPWIKQLKFKLMEMELKLEELENEFKYTLQEDYRIMLSKKYDYLTSHEAIEETIQANEYEFTEDGNIY